jgi:hypothetical protein
MMFESNQKDWDDFYLADTARGYQVGDIFFYNCKHYKLTKKTITAVIVERYYWWNRLADWLGGKLGL